LALKLYTKSPSHGSFFAESAFELLNRFIYLESPIQHRFLNNVCFAPQY